MLRGFITFLFTMLGGFIGYWIGSNIPTVNFNYFLGLLFASAVAGGLIVFYLSEDAKKRNTK